MSDKTTYTKLWEQGLMEGLYKRFSAVVKPFEIPLLELAVKKTNELFQAKDTISIFEIGAGSGQHTKTLLQGVAHRSQVTYTGIDVSLAQKNLFEENLSMLPNAVAIQEYVLSSWQDYHVTKKYDLVLAQHSWYGIGGDVRNFEKIKEILTEDGVCFIFLNPKSNISQIAMSANGENPFSSEDVEAGLTSCGLSFEKARSHSDTYSRKSFCKDGKLTKRGKDHFSYLYRKELQGSEQEVIDMINNTPDEAFRFPTDLIIVRK